MCAQWLLRGSGRAWLCCWHWHQLTPVLQGLLSLHCCAMPVTRPCVFRVISFFLPVRMSTAVPNKTEWTMIWSICWSTNVLAEPEVAEWDRQQQIIVQISDFHCILRLTWRLLLACRISQSPKIFCGSVLVQRCSVCAVLVFRNYLRRA